MKIFGVGFGCAALFTATFANAAIITQWDFNGSSSTTVPGTASSPTPSTGTGTASILNIATPTFSSGTANGGSSDPVNTSPPNFGWQTTTYAAQGAGSGTFGVAFTLPSASVPTSGALSFRVDMRHSNTSSRYVQISATRGSASVAPVVFEAALGGDTWYKLREIDLSSLVSGGTGDVSVAITTIFAPSTSTYVASTATSSYAASGTLRFDMATFADTIVPEPASLSLVGMALLATRRRK